jgi:multidrug efflux pump subunit AcrA (membrane-fusion protein)
MKFRRQALRHMQAPEQLDEVVRLATVPAWLLTIALTIGVAAAGIWSVYGTVTRSVSAPGLLIHANGISALDAVASGQVMKIWARPNQRLAKGTPIVTLDDGGQIVTTQAPWDAYVVNLLVAEGQLVQPGTPVADLERLDAPGDRLQAVVFVKASAAPLLRVGVPVEVSASAVPSGVFGTLSGRIATVGAFPETDESLRAFLGSAFDVRRLLQAGTVIRVTVPLEADLQSPGGLRWSKASPPFQLNSASEITARFTVSREHPIDWLLNR